MGATVVLSSLLVSVIIIVVIVILYNRDTLQDNATPNVNFRSLVSWGPLIVGNNVCEGYYFPPVSYDQLGTPTFNTKILESKDSLPMFSCLHSDTTNATLASRRCLADTCIGYDGTVYNNGESETVYTSCGSVSRCSNFISLVTIGNNMCLFYRPGGVLSDVCDLQHTTEIHLVYYSPTKRMCNIMNRATGKWLTGTYDSVKFEWSLGYSDSIAGIYSWCIINSLGFFNIRTPVTIGPQLAYTGTLNTTIVNSIEAANDMTDVVNILVANGCPVISSLYGEQLMSNGGLLYGPEVSSKVILH